MPHNRDNQSLIDILTAVQKALSYAEGVNRDILAADDLRLSAILYQLTIVGEATKRLSTETRTKYPDIAWKQMAGMRDFLVHAYDRVDFDILWTVIQQELPSLLEKLTPIIANIET